MKRAPTIAIALTLVMAMPVSGLAKPPSFGLWWKHFSAGIQRSVTRIDSACQKAYGQDDAKVGACFVRAERVSLRAQRSALQTQIAAISRGQRASCKRAIHQYWVASRRAATANLVYLDSHPRAGVRRLSRDLNAEPYASLKKSTYDAKSHAVDACG
jgi:hypothetical protein